MVSEGWLVVGGLGVQMDIWLSLMWCGCGVWYVLLEGGMDIILLTMPKGSISILPCCTLCMYNASNLL